MKCGRIQLIPASRWTCDSSQLHESGELAEWSRRVVLTRSCRMSDIHIPGHNRWEGYVDRLIYDVRGTYTGSNTMSRLYGKVHMRSPLSSYQSLDTARAEHCSARSIHPAKVTLQINDILRKMAYYFCAPGNRIWSSFVQIKQSIFSVRKGLWAEILIVDKAWLKDLGNEELLNLALVSQKTTPPGQLSIEPSWKAISHTTVFLVKKPTA